MRPSWRPGEVARTYSPPTLYTPKQWERLLALYRLYCGSVYGFAHTLHPRVGRLEPQEVARAKNALAQWQREATRDGRKRPVEEMDFPKEALLWLGQVLETTGAPMREYGGPYV